MKTLPGLFTRLTLSLALLIAPPAWAHGDEDHSHDAEPEVLTIATDTPRASAQSEEFELVAVLADRKMTLYLDEYASNAPVVDARVELESGTAKYVAKPIEPGVYELPGDGYTQAGKYPLVFSIETAESADLLTTTIEVVNDAIAAKDAKTATADASTPDNRLLWGAAGALLLLGVAGVLRWRRK